MISARLRNAELLEERVGYWPSFHDDEILSILLERRGPSISLRVLIAQSDREQREGRPVVSGYFEALLRFEDVGNVMLQDFNYQNVISSMQLSSVTEERFTTGKIEERIKVEVDSVFGVICSFSCREGSVVSVEDAQARTGSPSDRS